MSAINVKEIIPAQGFIQPNDIVAFQQLLFPFVITEIELADDKKAKKVVDERLNKRRQQYNFDWYLQNNVLSISDRNITASVVPCGTSGYYKSELIINNILTFHYQHSFQRGANYNARYLAMNSDVEHLKYAYFLYDIDEKKLKLSSLKLIVPSKESSVNISEIDLMPYFVSIKEGIINQIQAKKELQ